MRIEYPKGTVVFQQGREPKGVYVVFSGAILLTLRDAAGRQVPFRSVGQGCVMGLPASISGRAYSLSAKVVKDALLGFVPRAELLDLLRNQPRHCYRVVEVLSDEVALLRRESARLQPR